MKCKRNFFVGILVLELCPFERCWLLKKKNRINWPSKRFLLQYFYMHHKTLLECYSYLKIGRSNLFLMIITRQLDWTSVSDMLMGQWSFFRCKNLFSNLNEDMTGKTVSLIMGGAACSIGQRGEDRYCRRERPSYFFPWWLWVWDLSNLLPFETLDFSYNIISKLGWV